MRVLIRIQTRGGTSIGGQYKSYMCHYVFGVCLVIGGEARLLTSKYSRTQNNRGQTSFARDVFTHLWYSASPYRHKFRSCTVGLLLAQAVGKQKWPTEKSQKHAWEWDCRPQMCCKTKPKHSHEGIIFSLWVFTQPGHEADPLASLNRRTSVSPVYKWFTSGWLHCICECRQCTEWHI